MYKAFFVLFILSFLFSQSSEVSDLIEFNKAVKVGNNAYINGFGASPQKWAHLGNNAYHNGSSWNFLGAGSLLQLDDQRVNFYSHDASGNWLSTLKISQDAKVGIDLGISGVPTAKLDVNGNMRLRSLTGFGTRMVISDANGYLSSQPFYWQNNSAYLSTSKGIKLGNHAFISSNSSDPTSDFITISNNAYHSGTSWNFNGSGAAMQIKNQEINFYRHSASGVWTQSLIVNEFGHVGIGTREPGSFKLAVNGSLKAKEVVISSTGWADFVFNDNYKLPSLEETEKFIKKNRHLPDMPTEEEVLENGIELSVMQKKLLQKIEELTLYSIEQNKKTEKLFGIISSLREDNDNLKREIQKISTKNN
jgi:hypothetical protein